MASSIRRNELEHRSKRESAIARAVSCAATASRRSTPSCRCGDKHIREIMKKRKLTNNGDPFASLEQDVERRCQALQEQAEELVRQVQDNFRCAILKVPRAVQAMALTEFDKIGDGAKNDRLAKRGQEENDEPPPTVIKPRDARHAKSHRKSARQDTSPQKISAKGVPQTPAFDARLPETPAVHNGVRRSRRARNTIVASQAGDDKPRDTILVLQDDKEIVLPNGLGSPETKQQLAQLSRAERTEVKDVIQQQMEEMQRLLNQLEE